VSYAVGALNFCVGLVYLSVGVITLIEMARNWRRMGYSHFGAAWIALLFTCGPHYFVHGEHMLLQGQPGGALDLVAVLVALPTGVTWFLLRLEAFQGGRGDRFIRGTPGWLAVVPVAGGIYAGAMIVLIASLAAGSLDRLPEVFSSLILVATYLVVGYYLARTQLANRRPLGGWSLSGLALTAAFLGCATMHAVFATYTLTGLYPAEWHTGVVDWLAAPAALYFLWVVQALFRGTYRDWNVAGRVVPSARKATATS
jgi:hypothetical protein